MWCPFAAGRTVRVGPAKLALMALPKPRCKKRNLLVLKNPWKADRVCEASQGTANSDSSTARESLRGTASPLAGLSGGPEKTTEP